MPTGQLAPKPKPAEALRERVVRGSFTTAEKPDVDVSSTENLFPALRAVSQAYCAGVSVPAAAAASDGANSISVTVAVARPGSHSLGTDLAAQNIPRSCWAM